MCLDEARDTIRRRSPEGASPPSSATCAIRHRLPPPTSCGARVGSDRHPGQQPGSSKRMAFEQITDENWQADLS
jgi:hypothetical protein